MIKKAIILLVVFGLGWFLGTSNAASASASELPTMTVVEVKLPKKAMGKDITVGCTTEAGLQGFYMKADSRTERVIVKDADTLTGCTFYNGKKVIKVKRYSVTTMVPALPLQEIGQPVFYGGEMVTLDIDGTIITESGLTLDPISA
jgi:hypothetical protein